MKEATKHLAAYKGMCEGCMFNCTENEEDPDIECAYPKSMCIYTRDQIYGAVGKEKRAIDEQYRKIQEAISFNQKRLSELKAELKQASHLDREIAKAELQRIEKLLQNYRDWRQALIDQQRAI